jgi:maltooligosyltrehalose trehalohydrolase
LDGEPDRAMTPEPDGYFALTIPDAKPGQRYSYRLGADLRPDPASRFQPEGVLGPSEIVDPHRYVWNDATWRGIVSPHRQVFYEMHIGTFTKEGTWAAAEKHLADLADVGVTTLADFSGDFGWGYDGVDIFAPSRLYGPPDAARHFIDTAHQLGLAVILDVVYNHFGPVGNFVGQYSPTFFGKPGEWGDIINFDGPGSASVRAFVIENAEYWIAEYHFDGLRLDATQGIHDSSPEHVVSQLSRAARAAAGDRQIFIVAESEPQDTRLLRHGGAYSDGVDALWNEDWHHAAFVALTGRRQAYFTDYQGNAPEFAAMARHGFLYQGQWYSWQTNPRGGYSSGLPASCFVCFLENHDQVANTGLGTRLFQQVDPALWRTISAMLLLGPGLPLLFQGQEFASSARFPYFADQEGDLADAVRRGRLEFLRQFEGFRVPAVQDRLFKPDDPAGFYGAKLNQDERITNAESVRFHRELLTLRREDAVLGRIGTDEVTIESSAPTPSLLLIRYVSQYGHRLLMVNLADDHLSPMNDPLFAPLPGKRWKTLWASEAPEYGGSGVVAFVEAGRWLIQGSSATLLAIEGPARR